MPRAIRIHETGGPEVMRLEDVDVAPPGPDEVQVRHTAIGVNFIDVYDRTGLYPQKQMPAGLGREAAGVVTAVGKKVRGFKVGDRVGYVHNVPGSYSELRNVPATPLVKIPTGVSDEQAAVLMLKGMTVGYLLRHTHKVKRGDVIVLHAAAGGLGLMLSQWAKALGVTVIGVVGNDDKAKLAKKNGCKHLLVRGRDDIVASVRKLTKGVGADVVYDSVGKGHLLRVAGLPAQARAHGELRQRVGAGGAVRAGGACQARLIVADAPDAPRLHRHPCRSRRPGARSLFSGEEEVGEDPDQPALQTRRCGPGAPRPGSTQDHRRIGHPAGLRGAKLPGRLACLTQSEAHHFGEYLVDGDT